VKINSENGLPNLSEPVIEIDHSGHPRYLKAECIRRMYTKLLVTLRQNIVHFVHRLPLVLAAAFTN